MDESGNDNAVCSRKVGSGRRVAGAAIRSLINARSLEFECARVLNESLLVAVLTYGSETIRRRGLGLGLYRWTTSEVCCVSGERIKSRMHG